MRIGDLNFEFFKLKSTDTVDSAQAVTATSHKDWHNIKSVDISRKKSLSSLFSSVQAQKETLEVANKRRLKAHEAFQKYHKQGDPKKNGHHADLIETRQIWPIVVWYTNKDKAKSNSSIQSRTEFRSN